MTIEEIAAEMDERDTREEKFEFLMELGDTLPELPAGLLKDEHTVQGCQAKVWLIASRDKSHPSNLSFCAYSDAQSVRGLIVILLTVYSGRTPKEILAYPIEKLFERLQLTRQVIPMRSNGLHAMVRRIRALAEQAMAA